MCMLSAAMVVVMTCVNTVTTRKAYIQPDVNYYMEGDTVTLKCVVTNPTVDIDNVNIIFKGKNNTEIYLPFVRKGNRTLQTTIHDVRTGENGTVFCAYKHQSLAKQTFFVQGKPTLPEISCFYDYGLKVLNCSWSGSQTTCWTFQYRPAYGSNSDNFSSCEIYGSSLESCACNDLYCTRVIAPLPGYYNAICSVDPFENKNYLNNFYEIFISGRKITSTVSRKWPQVIDWNIVKLPPVENLTVGLITQYAADLSWPISRYPCEYQMNCKISHHRGGTTNESSHEVNIKCDSYTDPVSTSITSLYPNTSYEISVICREFGSNFWSDKTSVSLKTRPSAPIDGPKLDEGSYNVYICNSSHTCILLYWKTSTNLMNGLVTGYKVSLQEHHGKNTISMFGNVITATLTGMYVQSRDYRVSVWSKNDIGYSKMSSGLFIPARNTGVPQSFCVESRKIESTSDTSKYMVSWSNTDSVSRDVAVTYYQCLGYIIDNAVVICKSDFDWIKKTAESGFIVNVTVPLKTSTDEISSWHFGVSLSRNNVSTGITWDIASCGINTARENKGHSVYLVSLMVLLIPILIVGIWVVRCIKKMHKDDVPIVLPDTHKKNGNQKHVITHMFENKMINYMEKTIETGKLNDDVDLSIHSFSNKTFEKNEEPYEDDRSSGELNTGDRNESQNQSMESYVMQAVNASAQSNAHDISVDADVNEHSVNKFQKLLSVESKSCTENKKNPSQSDDITTKGNTSEQGSKFDIEDLSLNATTMNQEECSTGNQIGQAMEIPDLLTNHNDNYIMPMDLRISTMGKKHSGIPTNLNKETESSHGYIVHDYVQATNVNWPDGALDGHGLLDTDVIPPYMKNDGRINNEYTC